MIILICYSTSPSISVPFFTKNNCCLISSIGYRKCWSAEQEVAGSNPGQTNTEGLKITEENVLPLM